MELKCIEGEIRTSSRGLGVSPIRTSSMGYFAGSHPLGARSERKAEAKIEGWKDRMVVIRYSPRNPEISTLLKNDQPGGQLGN